MQDEGYGQAGSMMVSRLREAEKAGRPFALGADATYAGCRWPINVLSFQLVPMLAIA
jgi:hypothetical protein